MCDISYKDIGDYKKAIADYTQEIKVDPNFALAYYNRGIAYGELGYFKQETQDTRKACDLVSCDLLQILDENGLIRD